MFICLETGDFSKWRPMWTKFYQEHVINNSIDHWWFAVMFDFFWSQFQCWSLFLLVTFVFKENTGFFPFLLREILTLGCDLFYIFSVQVNICCVWMAKYIHVCVCVWLCILILWRDVKLYPKMSFKSSCFHFFMLKAGVYQMSFRKYVFNVIKTCLD